jgi:hypothetical protein
VARHVIWIWSTTDQMHKGILMLTSVVFSTSVFMFGIHAWVVWTVLTQKLRDNLISILVKSYRHYTTKS